MSNSSNQSGLNGSSLLRVRRTSTFVQNENQEEEYNNNNHQRIIEGESPAGAHESESDPYSEMPHSLIQSARFNEDSAQSGNNRRPRQNGSGSQSNGLYSSSGRIYENEGDRLMIHDRRMLEELFREALMFEE